MFGKIIVILHALVKLPKIIGTWCSNIRKVWYERKIENDVTDGDIDGVKSILHRVKQKRQSRRNKS